MITIRETHTFLDQIVSQKKVRLRERRIERSTEELRERCTAALLSGDLLSIPDFSAGLHHPGSLGVIAEIKKASPSKGLIAPDFQPEQQAMAYQSAGVGAISVLTEEDYFLGSVEYLRRVQSTVNLPILCKDFIIDAGQIYEARLMGTSAVLLICALLDDRTLEQFIRLTHELGMAALVEIHDLSQLMRALSVGAMLIGINNRDLRNFHVDIGVTERLAGLIPAGRTVVSESGLSTPEDMARVYRAGAHAVLIGETLMRTDKTEQAIRSCLQNLFRELPR